MPAITFIFSRAGCDAAVKQCLRSSLRLTTDEERARIAEVIDRRCADLADADLVVLGYHEWREGLLRGLAAHHAGMLPIFRHTVEELFTAGLVKAVFATETLALGINMPARTVVLERLVKFNGEQHVPLTPGEYTQLTGRAGRRGIDVEGHAVVLWHPRRRPRRGRRAGLHPHLPAAQFVRAVVQHDDQPGPPDGPRRRRTSCWNGRSRSTRPTGRWSGWCAASSAASSCSTRSPPNSAWHDAPILDYVRLRAKICRTGTGTGPGVAAAAAAGWPTRRWRRCAAATSSPSPTAGAAGWPWCWSPTATATDPRPLVLTEHRWAGRISSADYSGASAPLGSMTLPKRVEHRQPRVRRDLASALRSAAAGSDGPEPQAAAGAASRDVDPELAALRDQLRRHPAHTDRPTGRPRPASPSATCGSNGRTSSCGRRSPRPPTRWRAPSTASSGCSPSAVHRRGIRR